MYLWRVLTVDGLLANHEVIFLVFFRLLWSEWCYGAERDQD